MGGLCSCASLTMDGFEPLRWAPQCTAVLDMQASQMGTAVHRSA